MGSFITLKTQYKSLFEHHTCVKHREKKKMAFDYSLYHKNYTSVLGEINSHQDSIIVQS